MRPAPAHSSVHILLDHGDATVTASMLEGLGEVPCLDLAVRGDDFSVVLSLSGSRGRLAALLEDWRAALDALAPTGGERR